MLSATSKIPGQCHIVCNEPSLLFSSSNIAGRRMACVSLICLWLGPWAFQPFLLHNRSGKQMTGPLWTHQCLRVWHSKQNLHKVGACLVSSDTCQSLVHHAGLQWLEVLTGHGKINRIGIRFMPRVINTAVQKVKGICMCSHKVI